MTTILVTIGTSVNGRSKSLLVELPDQGPRRFRELSRHPRFRRVCGRCSKLAPVLLLLVLIWLSLVRVWRLVCGLDLAFGPCSELCDQDEGRRSVQSGRLLSLVAELDCPWRQHVG